MDNKNYNVTLLHTPESSTISNKLATLFKISADKAQRILNKESFIVKKQIDKATAEKFYKAITAIGANCRIDEITKSEDGDLPAIVEITNNAQVKPLTDITQAEIKPLDEEDVKLTLADGPAKKIAEAEKVFDEINPENLCPACGTIRAEADSVCIQCGYSPQITQHSNLKTKLIIAVIVITILAAGAIIGLPYYQQYNKRIQLKQDLNLAFDARNKVTRFIQKTNFWPNQNIDANLKKTINNNSLKSVVVSENAIITVTIRAAALDGQEQTLVFTPNILKGRIVWNCLKGSLSKKYRPKICLPRSTSK